MLNNLKSKVWCSRFCSCALHKHTLTHHRIIKWNSCALFHSLCERKDKCRKTCELDSYGRNIMHVRKFCANPKISSKKMECKGHTPLLQSLHSRAYSTNQIHSSSFTSSPILIFSSLCVCLCCYLMGPGHYLLLNSNFSHSNSTVWNKLASFEFCFPRHAAIKIQIFTLEYTVNATSM